MHDYRIDYEYQDGSDWAWDIVEARTAQDAVNVLRASLSIEIHITAVYRVVNNWR